MAEKEYSKEDIERALRVLNGSEAKASDGTILHEGDAVLARRGDGEYWEPCFFEGMGRKTYWVRHGTMPRQQCIPYKGNESLGWTCNPFPGQKPKEQKRATDEPFEWGERVRVWDDDLDDKLEAIFVKMIPDTDCPYEVLLYGRQFLSPWKHCERV